MSPTPNTDLNDQVSAVIDRLTTLNTARDAVLGLGRQAIRHAANSVRALHRGEFDQADILLAQSRDTVSQIRHLAGDLPQIYFAGYVQDALKEYAEAAITRALLLGEDLPTPGDLDIEDPAWLNALAESGSELRRDVLDLLREGNLQRASELLVAMDQIYSLLVTVDFPDALTGGLRRTTDQFRAVLERTRGDLTITMQQRRLESAIRELQDNLKNQATPE